MFFVPTVRQIGTNQFILGMNDESTFNRETKDLSKLLASPKK